MSNCAIFFAISFIYKHLLRVCLIWFILWQRQICLQCIAYSDNCMYNACVCAYLLHTHTHADRDAYTLLDKERKWHAMCKNAEQCIYMYGRHFYNSLFQRIHTIHQIPSGFTQYISHKTEEPNKRRTTRKLNEKTTTRSLVASQCSVT